MVALTVHSIFVVDGGGLVVDMSSFTDFLIVCNGLEGKHI